MDNSARSKLVDINRQFYDTFAPSFSATRGRVQPGVRELIGRFKKDTTVLDVGCGNGTLARALASTGFEGSYLGVDLSAGLLSIAKALLGEPTAGDYDFQQIDLAEPGWEAPLSGAPYNWLVSFAVLHHLPGEEFRQRIVRAIAGLTRPESTVAVSVWQWQNSPRLRKRVVPWGTVGLDPAELDEGDVLLDWRAGDQVGLRYVHTFTETSLTGLANHAGFEVRESFYSDGKPGNLALYQLWRLPA